mgnify:CR=1 FL=1
MPPFAMGKIPVTPVDSGNPVQFVNVPEVGVPKSGVTKDGEFPKLVKDDEVTPEARVEPVSVPAGATTKLLLTAVTSPFAFTVIVGITLDDPKEPMVLFTVARVAAKLPVPLPVTSPVRVIVWSPVLVPELVPLKFEAVIVLVPRSTSNAAPV